MTWVPFSTLTSSASVLPLTVNLASGDRHSAAAGPKGHHPVAERRRFFLRAVVEDDEVFADRGDSGFGRLDQAALFAAVEAIAVEDLGCVFGEGEPPDEHVAGVGVFFPLHDALLPVERAAVGRDGELGAAHEGRGLRRQQAGRPALAFGRFGEAGDRFDVGEARRQLPGTRVLRAGAVGPAGHRVGRAVRADGERLRFLARQPQFVRRCRRSGRRRRQSEPIRWTRGVLSSVFAEDDEVVAAGIDGDRLRVVQRFFAAGQRQRRRRRRDERRPARFGREDEDAPRPEGRARSFRRSVAGSGRRQPSIT